MSQEEFLDRIRTSSPTALAEEFLHSEIAHIFSNSAGYKAFRDRVVTLISFTESVAVVGSGNWRYSLNPDKNFREFGEHSDVDVAIVSSAQFHLLWEEMRLNHRRYYYALSEAQKLSLRRNSENVYGGFISPNWIPKRSLIQTYKYKQLLNTLSDKEVRFSKVKMLFFKNTDEAIDYYARGFRAARRTRP